MARNSIGGKKQVKFKMQINLRSVLMWLVVFLVFTPFLISLIGQPAVNQELTITQALQDMKGGKVESVEVDGTLLKLKYKEKDDKGQDVYKNARKETSENLSDLMKNAGIDTLITPVTVKDEESGKMWIDLLVNMVPFGLMVFFLFFMFRQARGAQDSVFSFGQSKAKLFDKGKQSVRFADVAGVDEAKNELEEVVDFLKNPAKYKAVGARTPKGVLLVGPSGVGKTLLARAVAGEAGVPFYSMAGSEFMEMLVGVGASRVRDLFGTAKKNAPAIIFIDEIDAIGRQRGSGFASGAHDEREQTLNQILVEMDGFTPNDNVIVLAATNRGDLLDSALLRPGRFDRRVTLELPDVEGRKQILGIYSKNKPFADDAEWTKIARRTVGFSGADLENMLNEAAIQAAKYDRKQITMADLEEAATKVKMGPEKRRLQTDLEKRMTAFHEAGHALVGFFMPRVDPVHRISIVSRGMALGYTMINPEKDRVHETQAQIEEEMAMMLGGRAAEQLVFGELTSGAVSDLERATRAARHMVMMFGMSELGPIYLGRPTDSMWERPQVSDQMMAKIDELTKKALDGAYKKAFKILSDKRDRLDLLAEKLMEIETVEGEDFEKLMGEDRPKVEGLEPKKL